MPHLAHLCYRCLRQQIQKVENLIAASKRSECEFRGDEGMHHKQALMKVFGNILVTCSQVFNPNRCIGENHRLRDRRRGTFLISGIVPPSEASRRALPRSIKAFKASRINAAFSSTPVNSWAVRTSSSSRATVVLIGTIIASFNAIVYAND